MRFARNFFALLLFALAPAAAHAQDVAHTADVAAHAADLFHNPLSPAFGNPDASVTVVEFYDYRCSYCKAAEAGIERILQEDKYVKVVFKDFAKLGPLSVTAAQATLAGLRQGADKYIRLHYILMSPQTSLTGEDMLYQAAASVGMNIDQLQNDMRDPAIAQQAQASMDLGRSVGVTVTPSFVVGKHFYPGFQTYDQLKQIIAYERANR